MMWVVIGLILVVFAVLGIGVFLVTEILLGALLIGLGYTVVK